MRQRNKMPLTNPCYLGKTIMVMVLTGDLNGNIIVLRIPITHAVPKNIPILCLDLRKALKCIEMIPQNIPIL